MAGIKAKPIKAKVPPIDRFPKELQKVSKDLGDYMSLEFKRTTFTWSKKNRPKWKPRYKAGKNIFKVEVSTTKKVAIYVSEGTKVRRAFLIKPFSAKTDPNRFIARKGQYSGVVVRKAYNFPGIEPRKFDDKVKIRVLKRMKRIKRQLDAILRSFTK